MLSIMEIKIFITDVATCLKSRKLTKSPMNSKEKGVRKVQHTKPHVQHLCSCSLSCNSKRSALHPLIQYTDTADSLTITYTQTV